MVKRKDIVRGTAVYVVKLMPSGSHAGPAFRGVLEFGERLIILTKPFSVGNLNLVNVEREKTGECFDVIYAFVTNFCSLAP